MSEKIYYAVSEESLSNVRNVWEQAELKNHRAAEKVVFHSLITPVMVMVWLLILAYMGQPNSMRFTCVIIWCGGAVTIIGAVALYFVTQGDDEMASKRADKVIADAIYDARVQTEIESITKPEEM